METGYKFNEEKLTPAKLKNEKFLKQCVENAYKMSVDVHPDSGNTGTRTDQKCEEYLKCLRYYATNVFYLPGRKIPEEIILKSTYVMKNYKSIIEKYGAIDARNAKDVVKEISEFDHGDDSHINDTISVLANRWSQDESEERNNLVEILNKMFETHIE